MFQPVFILNMVKKRDILTINQIFPYLRGLNLALGIKITPEMSFWDQNTKE